MKGKGSDGDKKARLAEALRANLARRKQQARSRAHQGDNVAPPADKPPQSPGNASKPD